MSIKDFLDTLNFRCTTDVDPLDAECRKIIYKEKVEEHKEIILGLLEYDEETKKAIFNAYHKGFSLLINKDRMESLGDKNDDKKD